MFKLSKLNEPSIYPFLIFALKLFAIIFVDSKLFFFPLFTLPSVKMSWSLNLFDFISKLPFAIKYLKLIEGTLDESESSMILPFIEIFPSALKKENSFWFFKGKSSKISWMSCFFKLIYAL